MGKRKRRTFTAEQKAEAVRIAQTSGKPVCQVARELDLTTSVLRTRMKQAEIDEAEDPNSPLTSEERSELVQLRRENKRLKMESFFSTLKTELIHDVVFTSRAAAKTAIAECIEIFYDGTRRSTTCRRSSMSADTTNNWK